MEFHVFLPDESIGIPGFLKDLNREKWNQWVSQFRLLPGDILLPRFRVEYKRDLTDTLQAMGLETLFNRNRANCERIRIGRDLFVNSVMQKAVVEVNEEGAETAAIRAMDLLGLADVEEEPEGLQDGCSSQIFGPPAQVADSRSLEQACDLMEQLR